MHITTEGLDIDWKEAFFILAVLVSGNEIAEAKKYIQMLMHRPTLRAVDPPSALVGDGDSKNSAGN